MYFRLLIITIIFLINFGTGYGQSNYDQKADEIVEKINSYLLEKHKDNEGLCYTIGAGDACHKDAFLTKKFLEKKFNSTNSISLKSIILYIFTKNLVGDHTGGSGINILDSDLAEFLKLDMNSLKILNSSYLEDKSGIYYYGNILGVRNNSYSYDLTSYSSQKNKLSVVYTGSSQGTIDNKQNQFISLDGKVFNTFDKEYLKVGEFIYQGANKVNTDGDTYTLLPGGVFAMYSDTIYYTNLNFLLPYLPLPGVDVDSFTIISSNTKGYGMHYAKDNKRTYGFTNDQGGSPGSPIYIDRVLNNNLDFSIDTSTHEFANKFYEIVNSYTVTDQDNGTDEDYTTSTRRYIDVQEREVQPTQYLREGNTVYYNNQLVESLDINSFKTISGIPRVDGKDENNWFLKGEIVYP